MYISDILVPVFIVATVAAMLFTTRGRWERDSRFLAIAWVLLVVLIIVGVLVVQAFALQVEQETEQHISRFTKLAASVIESMGHADVTNNAAMDDPHVQSLLQMIETEQRAFPTVAAFYTVRMLKSGRFIFVISPQNDYNRNGVYGEASAKEEAVPPGTPYPMGEAAERFLLLGLRGETRFTQTAFVDSWGKWVTVVAPIHAGRDGRVEAVLVGDIPVSEWNKFLADSAFWPPWGAFFVWSLYVITVVSLLQQQETITNFRSDHQQLQDETTSVYETKLLEGVTDSQKAVRAHIAHEIRTPFTAILGYAEMLAEKRFVSDEDWDVETQRSEAITVIRNNTEHVIEFIDGVFGGPSQRETHRFALHLRPFRLMQLLEEVVTLYKPQAVQKHIGLEIVGATPFPEQIITDRTRFKQVLLNLVSNAIKFTFNGKVGIIVAWQAGAASRATGNLHITIRDTGIGMSPETLASLFTPYHRADEVSRRGISGTGLGLSISREVMRQLGGDIRVSSEQQAGSSFVIQLPQV